MAGSTNQISQALFNYMCKHIVGTERAVKIKRMIYTVKNTIHSDSFKTAIISGSLGEGLEMKGSDLDIMYVQKRFQVFENKTTIQFNPVNTDCVLIMEDTKDGFTKLRVIYASHRQCRYLCREVDGVWYLSSFLLNLYDLKQVKGRIEYIEVIHGPCLSDIEGLTDMACCLHCKSWISPANQWITRHRGTWPDVDVMSKIIDHGVLFVPVGCKGSPNEDIEWRISFSVGEKLLIYSFTHTQLLCYALMKILLKDVINRDNRCKDLLCSYFMKTIIFWISEELPVSMWKPENLIPCFMQCVKRLIYCVKYAVCPHYFIQDKNLFESKIEGERHKNLLENLNNLISFEWRCILFSKQMQAFHIQYNLYINNSISFANTIENLLRSWIITIHPDEVNNCFSRMIKIITVFKSPRVKLVCLFLLSRDNINRSQSVYLSGKDGNKALYKQYKTLQCYILQSLYHDGMSGWLTLASFFYKMKQYNKAIYILSHSLSKCGAEKVLCGSNMLSMEQHRILHLNCWKEMGEQRAYNKLGLYRMTFIQNPP